MMEIMQNIQESESIVIDGDKKVGKFTFLLYALNKKYSKISVLTPLSANKIIKKIENINRSFISFNNFENFIDIFSFREDWIRIKNEYGFHFLYQDLEYFISHQPNDVILFHRVDSLFEYSDRDIIEEFFNYILSYGIKYKKKLVFTLNIDNVNYDLINYYLIESSDLYLRITKKGESREIEILYALSPILESTYIFETKNKKLFLYKKEKSNYKAHNISVIVISKNKKIQQMHKYLLEKPQIEIEIVDSISESLEAILTNPDYLIFSQDDEDINFSICELGQKYDLYTKILYLIDKPFIRIDDRLKAIETGCVDIVNFNIPKMHYVLELSKYLEVSFYKTSIIKDESKLHNYEEVKEYIDFLLKERILFTLVKIENKLSNFTFMRKYDKYIELDDYNMIIFINIVKEDVAIIFKKMKETFNILAVKDSLDIHFGDKSW